MVVILLLAQLISQPKVYFHPQASGLVIRYPQVADTVAVYFSLDGSSWKGNWMIAKTGFKEAYIPVMGQPIVLALLFKVGSVLDDNNGDLYLYEFKWMPRSILNIDFPTLERMLLTAQGKLLDPRYRDEAYNILSYLDHLSSRLPRYRKQFNQRVSDLRQRVRSEIQK